MAIRFIKATRQNGLYATDLDYDTAHDAASGAAGSFFAQNELDSYDSKYDIVRSFFYFDTSSLSGDTISAARLILWAETVEEANAGHGDLHLVEGVQNIPLQGTDYGDHLAKTTSGGTITYEDMLASYDGAYVFALVLDATGRGWINKSGNTKCCLRISGDKDDLTPAGEHNLVNMSPSGSFPGTTSSDATGVGMRYATLNGYHRGGTEDPPYFEVTHDGASDGFPRVRFNWGVSPNYTENTDWQYDIAALTNFSAYISGLVPNTQYKFRVELEDADGTDYGSAKYVTTDAYVSHPSDTMARVSSIRRIYRPGLLRMEVGVGELGFDVEVSEAAIKRVPDEVSEPEPAEDEEAIKGAVGEPIAPEEWAEIIKQQQATEWFKGMTAPTPVWSGKYTAPEQLKFLDIPVGAGTPTTKNFIATFSGGRTQVIKLPVGTTTKEARKIAASWGIGVMSIREA